jgi:hypothetical protein
LLVTLAVAVMELAGMPAKEVTFRPAARPLLFMSDTMLSIADCRTVPAKPEMLRSTAREPVVACWSARVEAWWSLL